MAGVQRGSRAKARSCSRAVFCDAVMVKGAAGCQRPAHREEPGAAANGSAAAAGTGVGAAVRRCSVAAVRRCSVAAVFCRSVAFNSE